MQHRDEGRNNSMSSDAKKKKALLSDTAAQVQVSKNNDKSLEILRADGPNWWPVEHSGMFFYSYLTDVISTCYSCTRLHGDRNYSLKSVYPLFKQVKLDDKNAQQKHHCVLACSSPG